MRTMKDSGIEWIGIIPSSWNLIRTKHYSYMKGRIGWQGLTSDEFIEEGPYLVTGTDFEDGHICWERSYHISDKRYEEAPDIQLKTGDLLVTKDGTIGKIAYIDSLPGKASLNSHLLVIRPLGNKYINRFMYWVLKSNVFIEYYSLVSEGSTMDSLSQEKMGNFIFPIPSIDEQKCISNYLDTYCGKLDGIITDLKAQVETLIKYKEALILETVTKGLDKSTPLQDSGIQWVGKVPINWTSKPIRSILLKIDGGAWGDDIDDYNEKGVICLRVADFDYDKGTFKATSEDDLTFRKYTKDVIRRLQLQKDDILIEKSGGGEKTPVGRAVIFDKEYTALFANFMDRIRVNENMVLAYFVEYWLKALYSCRVTPFYTTQTTGIQNLDVKLLVSKEKIIFPEIPEQQNIVDFLNNECDRIDSIMTYKKRQIASLLDYERSFIYECVTGKREIREVP